MTDPVIVPSRLTRRRHGKVDGVVIIETEAIWLHRGDVSETVEKLLMEDGRELYGCRKCDKVGVSRTSIGSHQKWHAHKEGRAKSQQAKTTRPEPPPVTSNGHGAVVLVRKPRSKRVIIAELDELYAQCDELEAELGAALGHNDTWGAGVTRRASPCGAAPPPG